MLAHAVSSRRCFHCVAAVVRGSTFPVHEVTVKDKPSTPIADRNTATSVVTGVLVVTRLLSNRSRVVFELCATTCEPLFLKMRNKPIAAAGAAICASTTSSELRWWRRWRRASCESAHARRLQVVLLTALGLPDRDIAHQVGMSRFHLGRVRRRFERDGLDGMADRPRRGRKSQVPAAQNRTPADGRGLTAAGGRGPLVAGPAGQRGGPQPIGGLQILVARGVPPYGRASSSDRE